MAIWVYSNQIFAQFGENRFQSPVRDGHTVVTHQDEKLLVDSLKSLDVELLKVDDVKVDYDQKQSIDLITAIWQGKEASTEHNTNNSTARSHIVWSLRGYGMVILPS